ncbi:tetratricopeptide repeat protein [Ktedonosporobacter rubrisoli]|nr:tetratricopeptide repeat protein [Ktedonosporobacter rubrisoli]
MTLKRDTQTHPNVFLRRARLERGWTQQEVADRIEAPRAFLVNRWENGVATPNSRYRERLCSLFEKSAKELGLAKYSSRSSSSRTIPPIYDDAIPLRHTRFGRLVGREEILRQLKECLWHEREMNYVALYGLPGVGKSSIAEALALDPEVEGYFADGILWATLGPQPDLPALFRRWGHLFGLSEQVVASECGEEGDVWASALRRKIGHRRILLVLDDAWRIEDALSSIVGGTACTYLLTTRIPDVALQFAGTAAFRVSELTQQDGVDLLTSLAPSLKNEPAEMIQRLVENVGGLPLALTLIGNYLLSLKRYPRRRIQAALDQLQYAETRLHLAQSQAGLMADPRLPAGSPLTLQSIIAMSVVLLDQTVRDVLVALASLPAKPYTFSEEVALAVANTTVEVLDSLIDAGLLEVINTNRYQIHQTTRDYAYTLQTNTRAEERLIAYVVAYLERSLQQDASLDIAEDGALEQEHHLLLQTLDLALKGNFNSEFVHCVCLITPYMHKRGWYSLGETYLQTAYQRAKALQDWPHLATIIRLLGTSLREREKDAEAEALLLEGLELFRQCERTQSVVDVLELLGTVTGGQGQYKCAERYFQEALELARQLDSSNQVGKILGNLGLLYAYQGKYSRAELLLQQGLALLRSCNAQSRLLAVFTNLGQVQTSLGKFLQAEATLQEGLRLAREWKYQNHLGYLLVAFGWLLMERGDYLLAQDTLQEAQGLARQSGVDSLAGEALAVCSMTFVKQGSFSRAQEFIEEGLHLVQESKANQRTLSLLKLVQGMLEFEQGCYSEAQEVLRQGLSACQEDDVEYRCFFLILLGLVALQKEDESLVKTYLPEGVALARQIAIPHCLGTGLLAQGEWQMKQAEFSAAEETFREVFSLCPVDFRELIAEAHTGLARVAIAQGQSLVAQQEAKMALGFLSEIGHYHQQAVSQLLTNVTDL